jgi:hypothetical protein
MPHWFDQRNSRLDEHGDKLDPRLFRSAHANPVHNVPMSWTASARLQLKQHTVLSVRSRIPALGSIVIVVGHGNGSESGGMEGSALPPAPPIDKAADWTSLHGREAAWGSDLASLVDDLPTTN